jgi:hypothetical protein
MPQQLTDPQDPDEIARIAGKDIYGTRVGVLRRTELFRLGNLWGMNFPIGASKDFMLPFFQRLESEGKNPLHPPSGAIQQTAELRKREVTFSEQSHIEVVPIVEDDFEARLKALPHGQLKKMCKLRGITHYARDKKPDLIARILAASEGTSEQDTPSGG